MPSKRPFLHQFVLWLILLSFPIAFSSVGHVLPKQKVRKGKDIALFFAVNKYQNYIDLKSPIKNANDIAKILKTRYDFETKVYENPSLKKIESVLDNYLEKYSKNELDADGQLLIYFSGHGIEDYFIAADTRRGAEHLTSISYSRWRKRLDKFNCKHILVAIDACYSVTFDPLRRATPTFSPPGGNGKRDKMLQHHDQYITRYFFTSDAKADQTPDKSEFAYQFLTALRRGGGADGLLTSREVYADLANAIPIGFTGKFGSHDPSATFLFIEKENNNNFQDDIRDEKDINAWNKAKKQHSIAAYSVYLESFPYGIFTNKARNNRKDLRDDNAWTIAKARDDPDYYLNKIPNGRHATEAKAMKISDAPSDMVFVKGGTFTMGCTSTQSGCQDDGKPAHKVTVDDFFIGMHEVTVKEYLVFVNETKKHYPEWLKKGNMYNIKTGSDNNYKNIGETLTNENNPIVGVNWNDAVAYCIWRSQKTGKTYRLPTEAEWEYAARGGNKSKKYKFAGSNDIESVAWCSSNSGSKTHPIGTKQKNELGIYDMSGNVWEWCSDWYDSAYYKTSPKRNPNGAASGELRIVRGGSLYNSYFLCQVAFRYGLNPAASNYMYGFRCARAL